MKKPTFRLSQKISSFHMENRASWRVISKVKATTLHGEDQQEMQEETL